MKLNVRATINSAFNATRNNSARLLKAIVIPSLIIALIESFRTFLPEDSWSQLILSIVEGIPYALIAVSCHRVILLREDELTNRWGMYWTNREFDYLIYGAVIMISLMVVFFLPIIVTTFIFAGSGAPNFVLLLYIGIPIIYVWSRASVILPSIAVDKKLEFWDAWELSNSNGWRLSLVLITPFLLIAGLGLIIYSVIPEPEGLISSFLDSLAFCVVGALEITFLSIAYKELSAGAEEPTA